MFKLSGKEYSNVIMDCCQMDQEFMPTVKKEVLDERDRKSPDNDSSGEGKKGASCSLEDF